MPNIQTPTKRMNFHQQPFKLSRDGCILISKKPISQMSANLPIREVYNLTASLYKPGGVEGYEAVKNYVDPIKLIEERQLRQKKVRPKKRATKRGSFLQDEAKVHKLVPGPGKYKVEEAWPEKAKLKPHYSDKMTEIAEIIKQGKKHKRPGPGQYKLFKSQKEVEAQKKEMSVRKIKMPDRTTYLDGVEHGASETPGVGNYNIRRRAQTQMSFSKYKTKPEQARKEHTLQAKKKMPTQPNQLTYTPKPADYTLFSSMTQTRNKNWFGKSARFQSCKSGSGVNPRKYSVMQEWRGKGDKKVERHGLEVLAKTRMYTSVYY